MRYGSFRTYLLVSCTFIGILQAAPVRAQDISTAQFDELKALLQAQQKAVADQAKTLREQGDQLREQRRQIDVQRRELENLRGSTKTRTAAQAPQPQAAVVAPVPTPVQGSAPPAAAIAQNAAPAPGARPEGTAAVQEDAVAARERQREQQSRIVQSNASLSRNSGVLTPGGVVSIEPSFDYAYQTQRQAVVSGFSIIPGITFGNINIVKTEERLATAALTVRAGITDRFEANVRIPYVLAYGSTTTSNVGQNAQPLTASASGAAIGDVELGASYQINDGNEGWPVFVGNLRFKTITGNDPFSLPIYTINDPNGQFLRGIPKKLPTGTGFYSLEPSLTVIYPSDPVVLFGNIRYVQNFGRTVDIQSDAGGPATPTYLQPGNGVGLNFGMGFALNDTTSFSLGYEHFHGFRASSGGSSIGGSDYDLGTLNFGLGYQLNKSVSFNLSVGVGVTPDTPAAKIMLSVPIKFNLF